LRTQTLRFDTTSMVGHVVRGILWMGSSTFVIYAIRMVNLMVLARLLTPQDFGIMATATVVINLVSLLQHLGIGPALVQRTDLKPIHIRVGFTLSLFFSGLITTAVWAAAPVIAHFFHLENLVAILRVLALTFLLTGLSIVARALLQREMRFRALAAIGALSHAVGYVGVGIPLAALGLGVWALVGAYLTEVLVSSGSALLLKRHDFRPTINWPTARELFSFGGSYTIARIANYVGTQVDKIIVARELGHHDLGIYSRAYYFVGLVCTLTEATVGRVLFAAMAQIQNEQERLAWAFLRTISLISAVLCPVVAVSIISAPELVDVLLGSQWGEVVKPFRMLAFGMFLGSLLDMSHYLLMARGTTYLLVGTQVLYACLVIVGAWIGRLWDVSGIAFGVVLAMAVSALLTFALSLRLTGVAWYVAFKVFLPPALSGGILGLWAWIISQILRSLNFPSVTILVVVGLSCSLIWVLLLRIASKFFLGHIGSEALCALFAFVPARMRHAAALFIGYKFLFGASNRAGGEGGA